MLVDIAHFVWVRKIRPMRLHSFFPFHPPSPRRRPVSIRREVFSSHAKLWLFYCRRPQIFSDNSARRISSFYHRKQCFLADPDVFSCRKLQAIVEYEFYQYCVFSNIATGRLDPKFGLHFEVPATIERSLQSYRALFGKGESSRLTWVGVHRWHATQEATDFNLKIPFGHVASSIALDDISSLKWPGIYAIS